jgi:hypothetical protein
MYSLYTPGMPGVAGVAAPAVQPPHVVHQAVDWHIAPCILLDAAVQAVKTVTCHCYLCHMLPVHVNNPPKGPGSVLMGRLCQISDCGKLV